MMKKTRLFLALLPLFSISIPVQAEPRIPVGHWALNSSLADLSSKHNAAKPKPIRPVSDLTWSNRNETADALHFENQESYKNNVNKQHLIVAYKPDYNFTDKMTISAFFKREKGGDNVTGVEQQNAWRLTSSVSGNKVRWTIRFLTTDGREYQLSSNNTVTTGEWAHVAATYDGQTISLYVEGEKSEKNVSFTIAKKYTPISIGVRDGVRYFNGDIDDVRLYDEALSDQEIVGLKKDKSLVGHWALNSSLADLSNNHNVATPKPIRPISDLTWSNRNETADALHFENQESYKNNVNKQHLIVAYKPDYNFTDKMTISAFFKREKGGDNVTGVEQQNAWRLTSSVSGNKVRWTIRFLTTDGRESQLSSNNTVTTGRWAHVAATYDGQTISLYVKGIKSEKNVSFTVAKKYTPISIGVRDGVRYFNGDIDDVRLYNRTLNDEEIKKILKSGQKISQVSYAQAHRLLTQATFGATEAEVQKVIKMGIEGWIDDQLNKCSIYETGLNMGCPEDHKKHIDRTIQIAKQISPTEWYASGGTNNYTGEIFNQLAGDQVSIFRMDAWWENALGHPDNNSGKDQLRQRVAYALSQLLVASDLNPRLHFHGESLAYYNDILAEYAFGNYLALLSKVARSPTMGIYLSYQGNATKDIKDNTIRADENFARELMQLFTIGLYKLNIDGSKVSGKNPDGSTYTNIPTYTQNNIAELSKVMTGWDLDHNGEYGSADPVLGHYYKDMIRIDNYHDTSGSVLGDNITTIDDALKKLVKHNNTAPFVSKHLIMSLVTSNPSPGYVSRVADTFVEKDGNLGEVIKKILMDDEARTGIIIDKDKIDLNKNIARPIFGKIKEPILAWTQFLRAFDVSPLQGWSGLRDNEPVVGIYNWEKPEDVFNQAPLRARSVFNFYSPDYIPSSSDFKKSNLVAPESQILTDQAILRLNNLFERFIATHERNAINRKGDTIEQFSKKQELRTDMPLMLVDFTTELNVFEEALDGNVDGDYLNISNSVQKEKAITALLEHLGKVLLGKPIEANSSNFKALRNHLLSIKSPSNNIDLAYKIIRESVRFIVTSSAFMVQK